MNDIALLLHLSLVGCRDAGSSSDHQRLEAEFAVVERTFATISEAKKWDRQDVFSALRDYERVAQISGNSAMASQLVVYKGLMDRNGQLAELPIYPGTSTKVIAILELGIRRLQESVRTRAFRLAEIESDHIHNFPQLLAASNKHTKLRYYTECEKSLFLARLRNEFGEDRYQDALAMFGELWNLLPL